MSKPPIRVAVVDDDESVRKALARLLSVCSFEAETYCSAREFVESGSVPECLVLDLHMPEASGLDLQFQLRRANIDILVVIISAHNDPEMRARCQSAGASAFLLKPINSTTLIGAIEAAVEGKRA